MFYSVPKIGTGFLVLVFGTGFWCVCHWLNTSLHIIHSIVSETQTFEIVTRKLLPSVT